MRQFRIASKFTVLSLKVQKHDQILWQRKYHKAHSLQNQRHYTLKSVTDDSHSSRGAEEGC